MKQTERKRETVLRREKGLCDGWMLREGRILPFYFSMQNWNEWFCLRDAFVRACVCVVYNYICDEEQRRCIRSDEM